MRRTFTGIIFIGFLLSSSATFAQNATADAKRALAAEWEDSTGKFQEWDPIAKRPTDNTTSGSQHCLKALELATRAKPDLEGALQELTYGSKTGPIDYSLPAELKSSLWDWLATATPATASERTNTVQGSFFDTASSIIGQFYMTKKSALMAVHGYIQKHNDARAIYELLNLASDSANQKPGSYLFGTFIAFGDKIPPVTLMEQFRLCYVADKQKLFDYVEAKFK